MTGENIDRCPVCSCEIEHRLSIGSRFTCDKCANEFFVKWNRDRRDLFFVNLADRGRGEPLGLPRGSIRAILMISISAICWYLMIIGRGVPNYLLNLVLIMIGYYFAFRSGDIDRMLNGSKEDGRIRHPLNLPRGTVRWMIVGGFLAAMIVQIAIGNIGGHEYIEFYFILFGLVIGHLARKARIEWFKLEVPSVIKHGKALLLLFIALFLLVVFVGGMDEFLPPLPLRLSIAVIGFYFGSRQ
ncbi:MAG: hypothetical protein ACMUHY_03130 [Thermoplasmatota archaeon]